jgi:hypothetical protein
MNKNFQFSTVTRLPDVYTANREPVSGLNDKVFFVDRIMCL